MEASEVKITNEEEIVALVEKRGITLDDIREAIAAGETTGKKLYRVDDDNRFLARAMVGKFNVYAEYSPDGDSFTVHTSYAHMVMFVSGDRG